MENDNEQYGPSMEYFRSYLEGRIKQELHSMAACSNDNGLEGMNTAHRMVAKTYGLAHDSGHGEAFHDYLAAAGSIVRHYRHQCAIEKSKIHERTLKRVGVKFRPSEAKREAKTNIAELVSVGVLGSAFFF